MFRVHGSAHQKSTSGSCFRIVSIHQLQAVLRRSIHLAWSLSQSSECTVSEDVLGPAQTHKWRTIHTYGYSVLLLLLRKFCGRSKPFPWYYRHPHFRGQAWSISLLTRRPDFRPRFHERHNNGWSAKLVDLHLGIGQMTIILWSCCECHCIPVWHCHWFAKNDRTFWT